MLALKMPYKEYQLNEQLVTSVQHVKRVSELL